MTEAASETPSQDPPIRIPDRSSLVLIGAGPIGVEAAAWAAGRNLDFLLLEKGEVGHHLRQWGHVRLFSPFGMNRSEWGRALLGSAPSPPRLPNDSSFLTGAEYLSGYLEPLSRLPGIRTRTFLGTEVVEVGREGLSKDTGVGDAGSRLEAPFRLLLRKGDGEMIHHTQAVIDCSGVYSNPQPFGSGNLPAPGEVRARREAAGHLHYGLPDILGRDRERFSNRRVLLIGGGYSAATSLEAFAVLVKQSPETRVLWVYTHPDRTPYPRFQNDPLPYRDQLARLGNSLASSPPPWLRCRPGSTVQKLSRWPGRDREGFQVALATPGGDEVVESDQILANTGFRPDGSLYRQLQIHQCYATGGPIKLAASLLGASGDCLNQESQGMENLENPEPNFFILGSKSYGTNSTFLIARGLEQIETVLPRLAGRL